MPKVITTNLPVISTEILYECCICLEKRKTITQPCMMDTHRICISCITKIVKSIPISETNPDLCCQYPFSECEYIYPKSFLRNVLKERYIIYKIAKDVYTYNDFCTMYCPSCSNLLIFEDELQEESVYECIYCFKKHCYTCQKQNSCELSSCVYCDGFYNTNPNSKNNFFYKKIKDRANLSDYFLRNFEITPEIACEQIVEKTKTMTVECPVCTASVFRTEQCNGLTHCHVEICFSCGEFTKIGEKLKDHWSARGHGCPRWETDPVYKKYIPNYCCQEGVCYSHGLGDCIDSNHEKGKQDLNEFKKKQYVYHSLKSLLPRIRYSVINILPENVKCYLPSPGTWDHLDCNNNSDDYRNHFLPPGKY